MELLSEIFEGYYQAKIIEILLENYNEEFTTKDILEMAGTARGSTYKYIEFLISREILIKTRKIGKVQLYKLNTDSNITQAFLLFEHSLVTSELDKKIKITEEKKTELSTSLKKYVENIVEYDSTDYSKQEIIDLEKYVTNTNITKEDVKKWKKVTI